MPTDSQTLPPAFDPLKWLVIQDSPAARETYARMKAQRRALERIYQIAEASNPLRAALDVETIGLIAMEALDE